MGDVICAVDSCERRAGGGGEEASAAFGADLRSCPPNKPLNGLYCCCCCGARWGGRCPPKPPNGQNCAAAGASKATLISAVALARASTPMVLAEQKLVRCTWFTSKRT